MKLQKEKRTLENLCTKRSSYSNSPPTELLKDISGLNKELKFNCFNKLFIETWAWVRLTLPPSMAAFNAIDKLAVLSRRPSSIEVLMPPWCMNLKHDDSFSCCFFVLTIRRHCSLFLIKLFDYTLICIYP